MELVESLIFVALAVAWVVYLVPKGLKMHEESRELDAVQDFSDDLRVVARRDVATSNEAELTVSTSRRSAARSGRAGKGASEPDVAAPSEDVALGEESTSSEGADSAAVWSEPVVPSRLRRVVAVLGRLVNRRSSTVARAPKAPISPAARRRRVLALLLTATMAVAGVAQAGLVSWWNLSFPVVLLIGWLGACRLMVRAERRRRRNNRRTQRTRSTAGANAPVAAVAEQAPAVPVADEPHTPYVTANAPAAPGSWDLVPTTLPTYVTKEAAGPRTTKPFTHDSTGVWSSGRNEIDSEIARRAAVDAAAQRERQVDAAERKLGS